MITRNSRSIFSRFLIGAGLLLGALAHAQSSVIPQIVDGGGWQSTIVVVNTTGIAGSATLTFYQETTAGATQNWSLPLLENISTQNLPLPAAGTVFLHTPGTAATNTQGWAAVQASAGIVAYAIYTYRSAGHADQDVTANGMPPASRILVPFDNSSGLATGVAVVNPTGSSESVSVNIRTDTGAVSTPPLPDLPAQGHTAFLLASQFPATSGQRGLAEFYCTNGTLAIIAIRANPTLAFTSAPVFSASGAPIITGGGSGPGGGGTPPAYSVVTITGTVTASDQTVYQAVIGMGSAVAGSYTVGTIVLAPAMSTGLAKLVGASASWNNVTVSNGTYTFNSLLTGLPSFMTDSSSAIYAITSASMNLTLAPGAAPTTGTVAGSVSLTSSLGTISGTIAGTFIATP